MTTQTAAIEKLMSEPGIYIATYDDLSFSDMFKVITHYIDHEGIAQWLTLFDFNTIGHITRNRRNSHGLSDDEFTRKLAIAHEDCMVPRTALWPRNKSFLDDTSSLKALIDSHIKVMSDPHSYPYYNVHSFPVNPRFIPKYSRIHSLEEFEHHFREYNKNAYQHQLLPMHTISRELLLHELNEYLLPYFYLPVQIKRLPNISL